MKEEKDNLQPQLSIYIRVYIVYIVYITITQNMSMMTYLLTLEISHVKV